MAFAAIAFTACNKAATNNSSTTSNSNSNTNSNSAANTPAPTKSSTGDYSTPTAAFRSFYEATKANNVEGIKRSVSKKTLEIMTKDATKENKTLDDMIRDTVKGAPSTFPETRNEKIDGDKAKLEFKDDKMDKWQPMSFVKENGEWKLAVVDEPADAMEGMDHSGTEKK
jgi:hypothetical protein